MGCLLKVLFILSICPKLYRNPPESPAGCSTLLRSRQRERGIESSRTEIEPAPVPRRRRPSPQATTTTGGHSPNDPTQLFFARLRTDARSDLKAIPTAKTYQFVTFCGRLKIGNIQS